MCGHAERQAGQRPESREIGALQGCAIGIDDRQLMVAVGRGAAMTRQVLKHREYAAGLQALGDRLGDGRDFAGLATIGTVANHRIAAGNRHVGNRQAVDVDAERP